jgi:hypothetical protein
MPAVAGLFYEADAGRLERHIAALMKNVRPLAEPAPRALIVPHAGYVYSGKTAAAAYACLAPIRNSVRRVLLFGPAHRVYLEGMAIPAADRFATPLGEVPLDREGAARIARLPEVCVSEEAHRQEHSLEVQLPFLQYVLGEFSLVPVVVGRCAPRTVAAAMDALWDEPGTLLIVSTDLSHFHPYDDARRIDTATCQQLLARSTSLNGEQACGAHALNGLMHSARRRSLQVEVLDLCNSGDTAGDRERVVGYGSFRLH